MRSTETSYQKKKIIFIMYYENGLFSNLTYDPLNTSNEVGQSH